MFAAVLKGAVVSRQAANLVKVPARTIYPQMSSNHIAGLPRTKVPFPEKVAAGMTIAGCIMATPFWIVTHMNDYRPLKGAGAEQEEEE